MARPLRIEYPGAVYHVTARGNEKKPVFKDDADRLNFLNTLQHVNKRYNWLCQTYCLMTNHYHLLIETPDGNLALGMRQLNGVYTQLFNKRHNRTGHLFQGRYKAILIQKDSHLLEVCRYVVLNPVRAGMAEKPDDYSWSSYRATAGKEKPHPSLTTDWVLGQFSGKRGKAEREYRQFVKWGIGKQTIWTEVRGQALLGKDDFVDKLADHLRKHKDITEIPRSQRYATRPALPVLLPEGILSDHRKLKRRLSDAVEKHGYRQSEIARQMGVHYSTISRWLREYENARRKT
ncbi:MAG TPA: transposase [Nitrospirota bacterium]|nr:transposase [Nitrospirota bacterium]